MPRVDDVAPGMVAPMTHLTFQYVLDHGAPTVDWDAWLADNDAGPFTPEFWDAAQKAFRCYMRDDDIGAQMYLAPFVWVRRP